MFGAFFQLSCKKTLEEKYSSPNSGESQLYSRNPDANCDLSTTICEDCQYQEAIDDDTVYSPTILGSPYNNPYSIANMTAAYNYIYTSSIPQIATTHYYVRFKPTSVAQLNVLDSLDFELYDYPLNVNVIQDGDYWPDAYTGLGEGEYPWLYSVVEKAFIPPSGIQTEILESLHIPDDNIVLEDEAFYITGNSVCDSSSYPALREERKEFYRLAPIDPCDFGALDGCSGGGGTGGGGGNPSLKPKGNINFKTYSINTSGRLGASGPLKFTRVIGKRFFKIDKTYTDINGNFQFAKSFPKKVTIVVKFRTSSTYGKHSVREEFSSFGVWKAMFPLKKNIGTFKGNNLQNLKYEFERGTTSIKRKTRFWIAGVSLNTTLETNSFLAENNMLTLPSDLRIYLNAITNQENLASFDLLRRSSAPLLNQHRYWLEEIWSYGTPSVAGAAALLIAFSSAGILTVPLALLAIHTFPQYPDIKLNYRTSDVNSITASKISIAVAQQLGIAYLDKVAQTSPPDGIDIGDYVLSLRSCLRFFTYNDYLPFGDNIPNSFYDYKPGVVAVWQSFSQHLGHTIADRIYGSGASDFQLQGKQWVSDISNSSSKKYLEEFDPQVGVPNDYFSWIPVGIINDLMDNTPDLPPSSVIDNVSGFTYYEIQTALFDQPGSIIDFRNSLKTIKPSQALEIDALFASYGY